MTSPGTSPPTRHGDPGKEHVKVLIVGGPDVLARRGLATELERLGQIRVWLAGTDAETSSTDDADVFRYGRLGWESLGRPGRFADVLSSLDPDVVVTFDTFPSFLAPAVMWRFPRPKLLRVITGRGRLAAPDPASRLGLRGFWMAQRIFDSRTDLYVFQNPDDLKTFQGRNLARSRATLIRGSGVLLDVPQRSPRLDGITRVVFVGRLLRQKGVSLLLDAAELLADMEVDDVRFLVAGPLAGRGLAHLERRLTAPPPNLEWLGEVRDVPRLLSTSDLMAYPTLYGEGIPRALLEAAACGLPLVATDSPGCREVVRHRWNGYLVAPSAEALALGCLRLHTDPAARDLMGKRSRQLVEDEFGLSDVARQYHQVILDLSRMVRVRRPA